MSPCLFLSLALLLLISVTTGSQSPSSTVTAELLPSSEGLPAIARTGRSSPMAPQNLWRRTLTDYTTLSSNSATAVLSSHTLRWLVGYPMGEGRRYVLRFLLLSFLINMCRLRETFSTTSGIPKLQTSSLPTITSSTFRTGPIVSLYIHTRPLSSPL